MTPPTLSHRRQTLTRLAAVMLIASVFGASASHAESLWQKRRANMSHAIRDSQAARVGDLLTILIGEDTNVSSRENRAFTKKSGSTGGLKLSGAASGALAETAADATLDLDNSSDRKFDGSAQFQATQSFVDRVTVTVMDVLPNGNLVIAGKRRIAIAGDSRELVVTGLVRPIDIGPANTVQSRHVGELTVDFDSRGDDQKFVRQGWFSRMANVAWPF